ncbi:N-6 DNA methylase [Pedobacter nutrimenti]|uniref:site-specific DNA-methyltransferase (adenine-specific) n=1 Tax=Pedobacter nutrimenti TaxID=1241337 RepID=A0A318U6H1_9SPHI|nr:N-6 DNA methylase [Pedobacter nutrimenti]PYF68450.1 N-6 DNA methylase [Pedobacter nutrimenti]
MSKNNSIENHDPHFKNVKKCFEKLANRQSYYTVFQDFVDFSLLMLDINKKPEDFADLETRWTTDTEYKLFAEMYLSWADYSVDFKDGLGDIFMEYISGGRNGQFFTPEPLCNMMAALTHVNTLSNGQSICDPACGSGRTLLAAAKINRNLNFYGADNDSLCAKMTALNMIINTMTGEVAHMDTLSMEHYKSWHIKTIPFGTGKLPTYFTTGPGQTFFIERLEKSSFKSDATHVTIPEDVGANKKGQYILF